MPAERDFDAVTSGGVLAALVGATAGSAADLVLPGLGGVAAVMVQAVGNTMGAVVGRRQEKAAEALAEACTASSLSVEELWTAVQNDDGKLEVLGRALAAAGRASTREKITTLGRALANGALADDVATVDRELIFIDALALLEAPHVRVLHIVALPSQQQMNGVVYNAADLAWSLEHLSSAYREAAGMVPALLATLISVGAVVDVAVGTLSYRPAWEASQFGHELLGRLHDASDAPSAGAATS